VATGAVGEQIQLLFLDAVFHLPAGAIESLYDGDKLFEEHAEYYRDDPGTLRGLLHWNSARGISGVARAAGFKRQKRRGHKLLFRLAKN
jgi:hypothetical protein